MPQPEEIVNFWQEAGPPKWYSKDEAFDQQIAVRFLDTHAKAAAGELDRWADTPLGALALLLLLDQFSRNLFRGSPKAFAQDAAARRIAQSALARGFDAQFDVSLRAFFYLPLMHSESLADQQLCVALCHSLPHRDTLPHGLIHERIIRRFGRFPHRNTILGRHTSPAEQDFLDGGGFAG